MLLVICDALLAITVEMADVRALLRNELAARRGAEAPKSSTVRASKKRKLEAEQADLRKRPRPTEPDTEHGDAESTAVEEVVIADAPPDTEDANDVTPSTMQVSSAPSEPEPEPQPQVVDEDEWAAFEREVAAPARAVPTTNAPLPADATISAAPVSAAELEARQREERDTRAVAQEEQVLGEREDAARSLEEEFAEMEELEQRVQKLKEKREELRRRKEEGMAATAGPMETTEPEPVEPEEIEDEDEDEDDWDNWRFRSRQ